MSDIVYVQAVPFCHGALDLAEPSQVIRRRRGNIMFRKILDVLKATRTLVDEGRDAAAQRAGRSPDAAREHRSALFGRSTWLEPTDDQSNYRGWSDDSSRDTDSSERGDDSTQQD
jgi:hypothetical protein